MDESRELVSQAVAGDRTALQQLLLMHGGALTAFIRETMPVALQNVLSVDDVLQESFLQAFRSISQLREPDEAVFRTWLRSIAQSCLRKAVAHANRQKRGGDRQRISRLAQAGGSLAERLVVEVWPDSVATPSHEAARGEAVCALQVALLQLPEIQARAIRLVYLQGRGVEEAAGELGKTVAATRGLVYRAKRRLEEAMERASKWIS